jgi:hypothetical protein
MTNTMQKLCPSWNAFAFQGDRFFPEMTQKKSVNITDIFFGGFGYSSTNFPIEISILS